MESNSFTDLKGKICAITGGAGVIGLSLSKGLASVGVKIAVLDLNKELADKAAEEIKAFSGIAAIGVEANVLDKESLQKAKSIVNSELGKIDILINCAGGNSPKATTAHEFITKENVHELEKTFYGLDIDGFRKVFDLNFLGTVLPTMVLTTDMIEM
jgi:NAD(P)-dependent dehydrogenase (short-subunit alcohol dehydrogenase family)